MNWNPNCISGLENLCPLEDMALFLHLLKIYSYLLLRGFEGDYRFKHLRIIKSTNHLEKINGINIFKQPISETED